MSNLSKYLSSNHLICRFHSPWWPYRPTNRVISKKYEHNIKFQEKEGSKMVYCPSEMFADAGVFDKAGRYLCNMQVWYERCIRFLLEGHLARNSNLKTCKTELTTSEYCTLFRLTLNKSFLLFRSEEHGSQKSKYEPEFHARFVTS